MEQALALGRREEVKVVVSNPCFELWLLYHFQELTSGVHRTVLLKEKLPKYLSGYNKRLPVNFPYAAHPKAKARALRAAPKHTETCHKGPNPSTTVWLLIDAIRNAGDAKRR
ncbi:hypothetical protein Tfu_0048 [Thermobifida fusca YX]|uniref:RloB-like protein n=1 Tax=Thermobifida fusca (strain YX) TaxID=269800 RepID=Q47TX8_THEFY|nr:hypothetical protein Tfu_0048 [Thermobifida fusca YX]MBO2528477.1 hypothetical protein [Thermobifida sp.]PZN61650.1 MAG: RloB domain-containing protein [Thermobifida fusca]